MKGVVEGGRVEEREVGGDGGGEGGGGMGGGLGVVDTATVVAVAKAPLAKRVVVWRRRGWRRWTW